MPDAPEVVANSMAQDATPDVEPEIRRRGRTPGAVNLFLIVAMAPFALGMLAALLLMIVDPYHLRPWGLRVRLDSGSYPQMQTANLIRARSSENHDLILFGGSTSMPFTPTQLNAAFGSDRAVNLSYSLPTPTDTRAVLQTVMTTPGLKHLIIEVDHSQMRRDSHMIIIGRTAVAGLNEHWFDMPDFTIETVHAALNRLWGLPFDLPEWRGEVGQLLNAPALTTHADLMLKLADAKSSPPPATFVTADFRPCDSYPFITKVVLPVAREARQRSIKVDIFFPPIPYLTYIVWQKSGIELGDWRPGSIYQQLGHFHQCIAEAANQYAAGTVTVHELDLDDPIISDLNNYRDTVHLTKPQALSAVLRDLENGKYALTPPRLGNYQSELNAHMRAAVQ